MDAKNGMNIINNLNSTHSKLPKIQSCIIHLQSRNKSIQLFWAPCHFNVAESERADELTKKTALCQDDIASVRWNI